MRKLVKSAKEQFENELRNALGLSENELLSTPDFLVPNELEIWYSSDDNNVLFVHRYENEWYGYEVFPSFHDIKRDSKLMSAILDFAKNDSESTFKEFYDFLLDDLAINAISKYSKINALYFSALSEARALQFVDEYEDVVETKNFTIKYDDWWKNCSFTDDEEVYNFCGEKTFYLSWAWSKSNDIFSYVLYDSAFNVVDRRFSFGIADIKEVIEDFLKEHLEGSFGLIVLPKHVFNNLVLK